MALKIKHKEVEFGVGDRIRVYQKIKEGEKERIAFFEGVLLGIKGAGDRKSILVRRIGEAGVGIERIFPISLPTITEIKVMKKGVRGTRRAKLYYTREKSQREIEKIYSRNKRKEAAKSAKPKKADKNKASKKTSTK